MTIEFTPSEQLEAKDKQKARERGREDAVLFRIFIENLRDSVIEAIGESNTNDSINKLGQKVNEKSMDKSLNNALQDALDSDELLEYDSDEMKVLADKLRFDPSVLVEMTPKRFFEYLDNLEASLIQ